MGLEGLLSTSSFQLRKIVRENHSSAIVSLLQTNNIIVSTSRNQLNLHDSHHCGDNLDIMANYIVDRPKNINKNDHLHKYFDTSSLDSHSCLISSYDDINMDFDFLIATACHDDVDGKVVKLQIIDLSQCEVINELNNVLACSRNIINYTPIPETLLFSCSNFIDSNTNYGYDKNDVSGIYLWNINYAINPDSINTDWLDKLSNNDNKYNDYNDSPLFLFRIITSKATNSPVTSISVSKDGSMVISGHNNGELFIWLLNKNQIFNDYNRLKEMLIIDKYIKITDKNYNYDINDYKLSELDSIHHLELRLINDKLNKYRLLISSINGKVFCIDLQNYIPISIFQVCTRVGPPCRFDVSNDGQYLFMGDYQGSVKILLLDDSNESKKGTIISHLKHGRSNKSITSVCYSEKYQTIVIGNVNGFLWRWDLCLTNKE